MRPPSKCFCVGVRAARENRKRDKSFFLPFFFPLSIAPHNLCPCALRLMSSSYVKLSLSILVFVADGPMSMPTVPISRMQVSQGIYVFLSKLWVRYKSVGEKPDCLLFLLELGGGVTAGSPFFQHYSLLLLCDGSCLSACLHVHTRHFASTWEVIQSFQKEDEYCG